LAATLADARNLVQDDRAPPVGGANSTAASTNIIAVLQNSGVGLIQFTHGMSHDLPAASGVRSAPGFIRTALSSKLGGPPRAARKARRGPTRPPSPQTQAPRTPAPPSAPRSAEEADDDLAKKPLLPGTEPVLPQQAADQANQVLDFLLGHDGERPIRRRDQPLPRATVLRGFADLRRVPRVLYSPRSCTTACRRRTTRRSTCRCRPSATCSSHDAVRVAGVRVGQVRSIDLDHSGRRVCGCRLNPGQAAARHGVAIRANGLLGARYVQLISRRSKDQLPDGRNDHCDARAFTNGLP